MLNLNATLDNLIAMVVVLLALSLVVQAVQSAVKKAFKLKSRQIEDSLVHLFQFVLHNETSAQVAPPDKTQAAAATDENAQAAAPGKQGQIDIWAHKWKGVTAMLTQSPFLRVFMRWVPHPAEEGGHHAAALYNEVVNQFRGIGRTAASTRPIFDSLSKSDLLNIVGSIDPNKIDRTFGTNVGTALEKFENFYKQFQDSAKWLEDSGFQAAVGFLSDDDKSKLADARAKLQPVLDDIRLLLTGDSRTGVEIETLVKDVAKLRAIKLDEVQAVFDDLRAGVVRSAERARLDGKPDVANALSGLADKLVPLSESFTAFRQKYNAIFANWVKLENSFDTVMQSFEERYARGMKMAAIIISFFVVVFLNANFFKVYQEISTSDAKRSLILQSREDVVRALSSNSGQQPTEQTVKTWFEASKAQINDSASTFTGYGFAPISWHDTKKWVGTLNPGGSGDWLAYRKHDLRVLLGWLIMALLLSVGAPFWQDFLESLFGVKNVLRKKSDTQNVEQKPGAGQTKQA
jgi:hypothetical protein